MHLTNRQHFAVIFTWDVAIPLSDVTKKQKDWTPCHKRIFHGTIYSQYALFTLNLPCFLAGNYMQIFSSFMERRVSHSLTHLPETGPWYCPQRSWCLQRVSEGVRVGAGLQGLQSLPAACWRELPGRHLPPSSAAECLTTATVSWMAFSSHQEFKGQNHCRNIVMTCSTGKAKI